MKPLLLWGSVMHARHAPARNAFRYAMFQLSLPLSQLEKTGSPLLGIERWRLFSFFNRDHGPRDGSALEPWIRARLKAHGLAAVCDGEIVLQTMPRLFGFVFNPVSFWYCHDRAGSLRAVLCEVNNTFGEHHDYLVAHPDRREIGVDDCLRATKVFHVSPFFEVRGEYHFRFRRDDGLHAVSIDYYDDGVKRLSTRLSASPLPLSATSLFRAWLRCPLLTLAVVARINWQALRLLAKRVPFFHKPALRAEES